MVNIRLLLFVGPFHAIDDTPAAWEMHGELMMRAKLLFVFNMEQLESTESNRLA